ncbi:MAG: hypothetical protein WBO76_04785, partial [Saprospiraceae bacterium]
MERYIAFFLIILFTDFDSKAQSNFDLVIPSFEYKVEAIVSPAIEIQDTIYCFVINQYAYKYGNSASFAKISKNGQIISNKDFLDSINPYWVYDTKKIKDGVLISGNQFIYKRRGFSLYYAKLNNKLDTIWSKTINTKYNSPGLNEIIQLKNGNILMAGSDNHNRPTGGTYQDSNNAVLILADSLGEIIKYNNIQKNNPMSLEGFDAVFEDKENNIYGVGKIQLGTLYNRGLI